MTCWPLSRLGFLQIYHNKGAQQWKLKAYIYFLGTIVRRKYMPIISAVRLFCSDKFEDTANEKVVYMSKLTKPYFSFWSFCSFKFSLFNCSKSWMEGYWHNLNILINTHCFVELIPSFIVWRRRQKFYSTMKSFKGC